MKIYFETERLILREIRDEDMIGIFDLESDSEVHRYLGNKPIKTIQESESIINYIKNQYDEHGIGRWAVIDKSSGEFIGWSGLKYEKLVREEMNYYDLGYRLRSEFWRKGIATETGKISLDYGFQVLELNEIFAGAQINNVGSNKVLKKLGFKFLELFDYDDMPHNWYRITKREWLDLKRLKK